jgi:hypothetical protein
MFRWREANCALFGAQFRYGRLHELVVRVKVALGGGEFRVSKELLNCLHVNVAADQARCGGVAKVVKAYPGNPGPPHRPSLFAANARYNCLPLDARLEHELSRSRFIRLEELQNGLRVIAALAILRLR